MSGVNGSGNIGNIKPNGDGAKKPDPQKLAIAAKNHIKDRVGNLANRSILAETNEEKTAIVNDLNTFINTWSSKETEFYFYAEKFAGDFLITSNPALNATELGRLNQVYIDVEDKVTKIDNQDVEKTIDIRTIKNKLARIRDQFQAEADMSKITDEIERDFDYQAILVKS